MFLMCKETRNVPDLVGQGSLLELTKLLKNRLCTELLYVVL